MGLRTSAFLSCVAVVLATAGAAWCLGCTHAEQESAKEDAGEPVVKVKTAVLKRSAMQKVIVAYGVVVTAPEKILRRSVGFEARVRRSYVAQGQVVAAGDALAEIEPSPATLLQVRQARSAFDNATRNLAQVKGRFDLKLGTNEEVLAAERDLNAARLQAESFSKMGVDVPFLKADSSGVVASVPVQAGLIVPAGSPIVDIAEQKYVEVKLNVEPADVADLKPDQPVAITLVNDDNAKPAEGRVRLVTRRVNPASRMVEVFVRLPVDSHFLLESFVRGRITVDAKEVLVVPRNAVVLKDDHYVLFTVRNGRAVMNVVKTGLEDEKGVEVIGNAIGEGTAVVIEGNSELKDGTAVAVE